MKDSDFESYGTARYALAGDELCFHQNNKDFIAWSEVRVKVLLIAGAVLLSEPTEKIFEYALEAEEIPSDPSVTETVTIHLSEMEYRLERYKRLNTPPPHRLLRPKEGYSGPILRKEHDRRVEPLNRFK